MGATMTKVPAESVTVCATAWSVESTSMTCRQRRGAPLRASRATPLSAGGCAASARVASSRKARTKANERMGMTARGEATGGASSTIHAGATQVNRRRRTSAAQLPARQRARLARVAREVGLERVDRHRLVEPFGEEGDQQLGRELAVEVQRDVRRE